MHTSPNITDTQKGIKSIENKSIAIAEILSITFLYYTLPAKIQNISEN